MMNVELVANLVFIGTFLACLLTLISILLGKGRALRNWMAKRSWQYSIRELLIVVTVVALLLGALAVLIDSMKSGA